MFEPSSEVTMSKGVLEVHSEKVAAVGGIIENRKLFVTIAYNCHGDFLYFCPMAKLTIEESDLDKGRFSRYKHEDFENECEFVNKVFIRWAGYDSTGMLMIEYVEQIIDWIADNTVSQWSVRTYQKHVSDIRFLFMFESHIDAVHFALRWK